jgi:biopolymer transport protein ExbD
VSGTVTAEVRAEPNLTPLLDVVFQLITFFMMVVNFSQDNYNQTIHLPVALSARPVEASRSAEDRLVLNIDSEGHLLFNGKNLTIEEAIKEIATQARLVKLNAEVTGTKIKPEDGLPTTIVIRGDRETQFSQFYRLVSACQANGFRKFALKAMNSAG